MNRKKSIGHIGVIASVNPERIRKESRHTRNAMFFYTVLLTQSEPLIKEGAW